MTEVRKHRRVTASGKRTTVRHHSRGGERTRREDEAEAAREAWADRNAPHVSTLGGETDPQPEEWWAEDDMPPPGAFWAEADEVGDWHGVSERDAYPCAGCGGTGMSRLAPTATCNRCDGSGNDPYAMR